MLKKYLRKIVRRKNPVFFNDLNSITPISPYFGMERGTPIDRYYINQFLMGHRRLIKGKVLEVGGDDYAKKYGDKKSVIDILNYKKERNTGIVHDDLTNRNTLKKEEYDCFICTQTLNFIYDISEAVRGIHYLLRKGGSVLATVAGISQISRYDMNRWGDYWRFTDLSLKKIFQSEFEGSGIEVQSFGNVLASIAFLQGAALDDLPKADLLEKKDLNYQLIIGLKATK